MELQNHGLKDEILHKAKITQVRGQWFEKNGIKLMPTYHPASVFHDEEKMEAIRKDFTVVKQASASLSPRSNVSALH